MLAARGRDGVGGAARVVTCEANPVVAAAAQRIIARNGWSERITVTAKPSHELVVGVDLAEPADLLLSETFSVQVVVEGALSTFEDAKARLLKPGAPVLPARALVRGALVGGEGLARSSRVERVLGLDLSHFNTLTPRQQYPSAGQPFGWLSEPATLLRFDLQNDAHFPAARQELTLTATARGVCQGVLQWLRIEQDDENDYEIPAGRRRLDFGGAALDSGLVPVPRAAPRGARPERGRARVAQPHRAVCRFKRLKTRAARYAARSLTTGARERSCRRATRFVGPRSATP